MVFVDMNIIEFSKFFFYLCKKVRLSLGTCSKLSSYTELFGAVAFVYTSDINKFAESKIFC